VEPLEQRAVPAVYRVTGTADGAGLITASVTPGVDFDATTLRGAVIAANANPGADTIQLPAGIYNLTVTNPGNVPEDAAASGDLDITGDLTLLNVGGGTTAIDATVLGDRVFHILAPPGGPHLPPCCPGAERGFAGPAGVGGRVPARRGAPVPRRPGPGSPGGACC
jgi:hypothetical protein